jgi:hypothetical protein
MRIEPQEVAQAKQLAVPLAGHRLEVPSLIGRSRSCV